MKKKIFSRLYKFWNYFISKRWSWSLTFRWILLIGINLWFNLQFFGYNRSRDAHITIQFIFGFFYFFKPEILKIKTTKNNSSFLKYKLFDPRTIFYNLSLLSYPYEIYRQENILLSTLQTFLSTNKEEKKSSVSIYNLLNYNMEMLFIINLNIFLISIFFYFWRKVYFLL